MNERLNELEFDCLEATSRRLSAYRTALLDHAQRWCAAGPPCPGTFRPTLGILAMLLRRHRVQEYKYRTDISRMEEKLAFIADDAGAEQEDEIARLRQKIQLALDAVEDVVRALRHISAQEPHAVQEHLRTEQTFYLDRFLKSIENKPTALIRFEPLSMNMEVDGMPAGQLLSVGTNARHGAQVVDHLYVWTWGRFWYRVPSEDAARQYVHDYNLLFNPYKETND